MADELLAEYRRELGDLKRERDDLKKALDKREDDNKGYRDELKTLTEERDGLKKQLPSEGSVVLGKADNARWETVKALGSVDDIVAKVKGYDGLEAKDKRRERNDSIKNLNLKPSIFEVVAEGKAYRVEGEGDERVIYLAVDEGEQELTSYANERGLGDLLGVMGLSESKEEESKGRTFTGAGKRKPGEFRALSAEERTKQKQDESRYKGM